MARAEIAAVRPRDIYTTGQVAKLFGVAPRTITKWTDSSRLRAVRIPGSQDRRITRAALAEFVATYPGMADLIEAAGHDLEEVLGPEWSPVGAGVAS